MSSGFIPAGTFVPPSSGSAPPSEDPSDAAWAAARAAVSSSSSSSATAIAAPATGAGVTAGPPEDTRSLYEILQSNKARKQEEFEEKLKFKNQFRPLDDDDVEFLDSVLDGQKRVELERRRAVEGEVERFRERQMGEDTARVGGEDDEEELKWGKRKRGERGRRLAGVKVKRKGSVGDSEAKKRMVEDGQGGEGPGERGDRGEREGQEGQEGEWRKRKAEEEDGVDADEGKKRKVVEDEEGKAADGGDKNAVVVAVEKKVQVPPPESKPPAAALGLDYGSGDDDDD